MTNKNQVQGIKDKSDEIESKLQDFKHTTHPTRISKSKLMPYAAFILRLHADNYSSHQITNFLKTIDVKVASSTVRRFIVRIEGHSQEILDSFNINESKNLSTRIDSEVTTCEEKTQLNPNPLQNIKRPKQNKLQYTIHKDEDTN